MTAQLNLYGYEHKSAVISIVGGFRPVSAIHTTKLRALITSLSKLDIITATSQRVSIYLGLNSNYMHI